MCVRFLKDERLKATIDLPRLDIDHGEICLKKRKTRMSRTTTTIMYDVISEEESLKRDCSFQQFFLHIMYLN